MTVVDMADVMVPLAVVADAYRLPLSTLYRWAAQGRIAADDGRPRKIRLADVDACISGPSEKYFQA